MKLQTKLILAITLSISFLAAVSFGYLTAHLRDFMVDRDQGHLLSKLKVAATFLEALAPDMHDRDRMDGLADRLAADSAARVTIMAPDGTVVGDSAVAAEDIAGVENHLFRPEVQDALGYGMGESRRFSSTVRREYQYLAMRFGSLSPDSPAPQGIVRMAVPLASFETTMRQLTHMVGFALVTLVMLLVISSVLIMRNVSQPVKRIAHIARGIAAGDFSHRASAAGTDEIRDLAEAINFMSAQIKSRIEEVTQGRSRLEAVFSSMVEGVMLIDREGRITLVNKSLRSFLGFEQDPGGKTPIEVIRNMDIQELARDILANREPVMKRLLQVSAPEEKLLQVHAAAIRARGEVQGAVLVFHNITDLTRLENIRRDFVANVSHELRTPIASIKGYAETLLGGAMAEPENAGEFLSIILQESNRLAALIDDLLDLARIESGKMEMAQQPCVLKPVVERVLAGFKRRLAGKKLQTAIHVPDDLPPVFADEARLSQVLVNLIDNAVKFTPDGGSITIAAEARQGFAHIRVTDTGVGIPLADQPRLFERFYRVDKARSRELGGTGLGLAIVKHIVQAHKGEVILSSTPGQGTTFIVSFPLTS